MVLLIGTRWNRVNRRRVRQDLVLGHEGSRRVLVQHHPRVDPGLRGQERGQAAVETWVDEQRRSAFADGPEFGHSQFREVEGEGDRLAVEVAAADHLAVTGPDCFGPGYRSIREHQRVVRGGVDLDEEHPPEVVQGVPHRAVDLRHAAKRIGILDFVDIAVVAVLKGGPSQKRAQVCCHGRLAGVRTGGVVRRRKGDVGAEERLEAQCSGDAGGPHQAVRVGQQKCSDRGHHLRSVEERQALLGLECEGLQPDLT